MNEKLKNIFVIIGAFFGGLFTCLFGFFLHSNRKSDEGTERDLSELSDIGNKLSDVATGLGEVGNEISDIDERLSDTNNELKSNGDRLGKLIAEIEKTKVDN